MRTMKGDLFSQVLHALEGEEIHMQALQTKDGPKEVETRTWGPERWIERAHDTGVITAIEAMAIILFVIGGPSKRRDERKIVGQWAAEMKRAIASGAIGPRDPDSLLPLASMPKDWGWVVGADVIDDWLKTLGMGWTATEIIRHMHAQCGQAAPEDVGQLGKSVPGCDAAALIDQGSTRKPRPIQEVRESAFREWLEGAGAEYVTDGVLYRLTQAETWGKLGEKEANLFRAKGKDTIKAFFAKQQLVRFKPGKPE